MKIICYSRLFIVLQYFAVDYLDGPLVFISLQCFPKCFVQKLVFLKRDRKTRMYFLVLVLFVLTALGLNTVSTMKVNA